MRSFFITQIVLLALAITFQARGARLKDIANIRGVRDNQLIGYGIVVGLAGTGDSQLEYTNKSVKRMLDKLGMKTESGSVSSKNVAAVLITSTLPPFARSGNKIDVTVNSLGDASSLAGGTLIQTPLRAADEQVYAVAQGSVLVGASKDKGFLTVGRVPDGAIIEQDITPDFSTRKMFRLTLHNPDFTTAARVAAKINGDLAGKYATALDGATVDLVVPANFQGKGVELLAAIESLEVSPDSIARVVVNEKTGTVIIGDGVRISRVAVSHGDLTVKVDGTAGGKSKDQGGDKIGLVQGEASVGEVVNALNRLGISPKDLITVLQNIKAAGALQGDLEIL